MPRIIRKNYRFLFPLLSVILILPALMGLIHQGFPLTDDGGWMVVRFSAFYETLRSGQFPVRFLMRLNNGYGYPVSDFLYPLFMYLGVPLHVLKLNFQDTIKALFALSLVFSSLFTFFWLRKIFDNLSSLTGALVYSLFPYYLYDVYKRGSLGEVLALSILPFILWQFERRSMLFTSLGLGLIILSHNTLAILLIPVVLLYVYLRNKKKKKFLFLALLFGILISGFFSIPALFDLQYTVFGKTQVSDFYNYFVGFSNFSILGPVFLFVMFSSLTAFFIRTKENKNFSLFLSSFVFSLLILFLITPLSRIIWSFVPFKGLIQFPFRLVSVIIPLVAFQAAFLISVFDKWRKLLIFFVTLVLVFVSAKPLMFPSDYQYFPDTFYSTNQGTTTVRNEYMPKWVTNVPQTMYQSKVVVIGGNGKINLEDSTPEKTVFSIFTPGKATVQINTIYFPGWRAYVNKTEVPISYTNPMGLIRINLNKGTNNVKVVFSETSLRLLSDILSLLGISGLLLFAFLIKKKRLKL